MAEPAKKFWIETFGCQMNVHDSERVAGTLVAHGYTPVERMEDADVILFNTCSIRDKAAQKVFNRLAQFRSLRKQGKRFGVLGCVAQQEGEAIFERAPHVALVVGSPSYPRLPELLDRLEAGETRITGLGEASDEAFETELTRRDHPFRSYITIIEGCNKHCAYCVVPYTRGKERSRASAAILDEARRLADAGYTEIQLLGQNVNSYLDPSPARRSFAELLAAVASVGGIRRVRYTTSHPRDFTRDIVDVMAACPALCEHVHLPVQSGSDDVLRLMRRGYTRERYLEAVGWIRSCPRPLAITTDIIVGFPGETDDDFERTLDLMAVVRYSGAFSFKYSRRPHTEAESWEDSIAEEVKSERLMIVQRRQQEIQHEDNQAWIGRSIEVMVEAFNPKLAQWVGRSGTNRTVNFTADETLGAFEPGDYLDVRIARAGANSFVGEQISSPERMPRPARLPVPGADAPRDGGRLAAALIAPELPQSARELVNISL
jgi:tRNA-2-methylthio-N6-dimethylallyladenosine synthase